MNASRDNSLADVADVLGYVRKLGVKLWLQDGELRYRAPKGALTQVDIARLHASKDKLVALLKGVGAGRDLGLPLGPRAAGARVPLTFSQWTHWRSRRLVDQPGVRQLAAATRLCGPLDLDLLRQCLKDIVRRHEALRTRIVVIDGMPTQLTDLPGTCELQVHDLSAYSRSAREAAVRRMIDDVILEPVDLAAGLFAVRLARLARDEHVLIVAMEHIVSDARSMSIIHRDLFALYRAALQAERPALPVLPVQFADYAVWQQRVCASQIRKHSAYWQEHLQASPPLRFPVDENAPGMPSTGWAAVPVRTDSALRRRLVEWSQQHGTTLAMSIFTVYAALVLRWCGASQGVLRYQSDGRHRVEVEHTVGFFATVLNVPLELRACDRFLDLLDRVTNEYCAAHEHADDAYLDTLEPAPAFAANPGFNWVPEEAASHLPAGQDSQTAVTLQRVPFQSPLLKTSRRQGEPLILLYDHGDEAVGGIHFPQSRFSTATIERFRRNLCLLLDAMLCRPEQRVADIIIE
jgi:Condensation domain/TubC N-terminal docking domain